MQRASLILAGGRAQRFGSPKSLADLEGRPLIAHVAAALSASPLAVAGDAAAAEACGGVRLEDPPGAARGPLAGLAAGLAWAAALQVDWLVTAPCDAPLLPADFGQRLIAGAGAAPAAFAVTPEGAHPLCAAWRPGVVAAAALTAARQDKHPALRAFAEACGAVAVRFTAGEAFLNVNTPGDLERARALVRRP